MIKQIEDFSKHIGIVGFRDVQISDVDHLLSLVRQKLGDVTVQFFDAQLVAGWQHLYFATLNSLKAFKNRTNISKNLAVECLLYASAQRQIRVALNLMGIKQNSSQIAVLVVADEENVAEKSLTEVSKLILGKRDDGVLDLSVEKMAYIRRLFDISDTELAAKLEEDGEKKALSDLVIEHVALLVTRR
ncbi:MAG: KEOPS complex subunit Cgi121 [Candidatus Bathyarchaeota archaeon]|nr:KEOPS complex subunit Cgi121 [Candidatus Bathyarchaeota archaeon]MDH5494630.1 KEOPS complex subunit Cgi121 [Candidatus Bathyarchaeota archaeon]